MRIAPAGRRTLVLALLALAAVLMLQAPHTPPLYDGIGFPDEPYRWFGRSVLPAGPAVAAFTQGVGGQVRGASAEQGPQVTFAMTAADLRFPAGVRTLQVRADAAQAPASPADGTLASNLYRLSASTAGSAVPLRDPVLPTASVLLSLRIDRATTQNVVIETWDGATWRQLPTLQVGTDIYAANANSLPSFAAIKLRPGVRPTVTFSAAPPGPHGSTTGTLPTPAPDTTPGPLATRPSMSPWLAVVGVLGLVVATLALARRRTPGS